MRLEEAKTLLDNELADGAYYLSGYAIECALKACIASRTKQWDFPDKRLVIDAYVHDLAKLLRTAGLEVARDDQFTADHLFKANWLTVQLWSEQCRYERHGHRKAEDLYSAIADPKHGVLEWIKQYW